MGERKGRDGFEVVSFETGEVIHFVECTSTHQREKVEAGLLRNMNFEKYYIRDTRDSSDPPTDSEVG